MSLINQVRHMYLLTVFNISAHIGVPLTLGSDLHLEIMRSMCNNSSVPREFAAQTEIQRHIARYILSLDPQNDPQNRCSITKVFDRELEAIRPNFQNSWSAQTEFSLLGAKLYPYAMCFAPQTAPPRGYPEQDRSADMRISTRAILHQGLATIVRLVNVFAGFSRLPEREFDTSLSHKGQVDFDHRVFYPKVYFPVLFFAVYFLLFYLSKNSGAKDEDKGCRSKASREYLPNILKHSHFGRTQTRSEKHRSPKRCYHS